MSDPDLIYSVIRSCGKCTAMYISKDILHKSSGEQFLWNKIEIWAGFGQVSNYEKKIRPIMSNL